MYNYLQVYVANQSQLPNVQIPKALSRSGIGKAFS